MPLMRGARGVSKTQGVMSMMKPFSSPGTPGFVPYTALPWHTTALLAPAVVLISRAQGLTLDPVVDHQPDCWPIGFYEVDDVVSTSTLSGR